ncbi:DNA-binding transcriptional regulator, LysR family [Parafrankia irregularis]|uniref:DNA-binding transcriptional regulator, LysR family n=1 Tax=Parafrankia irregularis TaxID=795642 RepID=A0A0S4QIY6_9ACTN|nr:MULTISPECIES: LysR family transcriptional regulator [Parafrankia]MBE3200847.1 LysR family transcriptional regulator [Parafrankia sp. CH37]CUU54760.1 DNA-binding transcriptional regulator, LysR family [Parafrankia irregularis]
MDTHRLGYFLRVADEGSISRAASVLGIAQPALSRHIRLLEEDLGVTLFLRTARGVQLTEEGERLRATTAAPLRQLELAMLYVGSPLARIERGLHIGLPTTAAGVLAVPLLESLGAAFPKVHFQITVAGTEELVEGILKGVVDIAMIGPLSDGRLFYEDLLEDDLLVVGAGSADLRPDRAVSFAELTAHPLVLPASATGVRTSVENTALRLKLRITARFVTDSLQVMKDLIGAGYGWGVLPLSACGPEIDAGVLRAAPLRDPSLATRFGIAVTTHLELPTGFATRVIEIIKSEAARLIGTGAWAARLLPHPPADGS